MEAPEFSAHHDSPSGQAPLSFSHQAREAREALAGMEGWILFSALLSPATSLVLSHHFPSSLHLTAVRSLAETTDQSPRGRCRLTPSLPNAQPFAFAVFTFTIVLAVSRWLYVSPVSRREPPFSLNFLLLSQLPLFPLHAQSSPTQQRQSSHNILTRISVSPCPNNVLCPLRWEAKYPLSGAGTHMTQPRLRPPIVRLYAAFWPPNHTSPLAQAALSHPSIVWMTWSHIHLPQKSLYIFPPPCPHASSSKSAVLAPPISHRSHIASSLSNPQHV